MRSAYNGNKKGISNRDGAALSAILVVLEMISAQLQDIEADIGASVDGVCSGFSGMGIRAKTALASACDALDSSTDGGGLQAFVHRVKNALEVLLNRMEAAKEFDQLLATELRETKERLSLIDRLSQKMIEVGLRASTLIPKSKYENMDEAERAEEFQHLMEQISVVAYAANQAGKAISDIHSGIQSALDSSCKKITQKSRDDAEISRTTENRIRDILDKLSGTYERMSKSLASSATMSRQLNLDINQAVMSMQFQDRVSQRMHHLLETISELISDLRPHTDRDDKETAESITQFWLNRINQRATMASERELIEPNSATKDSTDVELF